MKLSASYMIKSRGKITRFFYTGIGYVACLRRSYKFFRMEVAQEMKKEMDVEPVIEEPKIKASVDLTNTDDNYVPAEKKSKASSSIWDNFIKVDKLQAKCRSCSVVLKTPTGSTSALIRHFKSKHSSDTKAAEDQKEEKQRAVIPLDSTNKKVKEMTRGLALMIAKDLQPYSVVEDVGFRYFANAAEPRFQMPSRTTLSRKIIPEMYETEVDRIKLKLQIDLKGIYFNSYIKSSHSILKYVPLLTE